MKHKACFILFDF